MEARDLTTEEMIQALSKSKNELVALKCQRILNKETTILTERIWSGSFMTYVLTGDFKNAMRSADSHNREALENAHLLIDIND
jgi:hypothetical protein